MSDHTDSNNGAPARLVTLEELQAEIRDLVSRVAASPGRLAVESRPSPCRTPLAMPGAEWSEAEDCSRG